MSVASLKNLVERGRLGKNIGMTMGLPKLETVIDGVAQGVYTLIFGGTGSGKTSFALYAYIYRPLMDNLENDTFKVIYYSLEMSAEMLLGKLASMYMLEHFGVELSVKDLLSKNKDNILSDEHYEIFLQTTEFLYKLESKLLIYDKALTADRMYAHLSTEMLKYGVEEETEHRRIYHLNNPEQITLVIIDHIALIRKDKGRTKKEEIDLCSNYLVTFRNRYRVSPLVIMQMNRASSAMDRRSAGFSEPQLDDIKKSGGLT